jgi:mannose-6-phosphate isomerase-like protein (cupin superfamily)
MAFAMPGGGEMADWLLPGAVGPETPIDEGCLITEYLNRADCADVSVALARVPAGTRTRLHALEGITERHVILSGSGVAEVGGESAAVAPGDIAVIPAGAAQRITADPGSDLSFLCICTPRFRPAAYRDLEAPHTGPAPGAATERPRHEAGAGGEQERE